MSYVECILVYTFVSFVSNLLEYFHTMSKKFLVGGQNVPENNFK